jgi:pSer/pThr/pTyr-binding forkhead associated (FHA) protein
MRDGQTQRLKTAAIDGPAPEGYLRRWRTFLVMLSGEASGDAFELRKTPVILGRGPGVDIAIDDRTLSRQHLILELTAEGFRVRDLDSTNGVILNGKRIDAARLQHGDRLEAGDHEFTYIVEEVQDQGRVYDVQQ